MLIESPDFLWIVLLFFMVATLYSSAGFGGGSSYLAILALVFANFFTIRSTALMCNLIVVSGSFYLFYQKGHINFRQSLPFIITSIPMAFIGAMFQMRETSFFIILGFALIVSSIALVIQSYMQKGPRSENRMYPSYLSYVLGGGIGLLSGLVGIGGGIFLAPVLHHIRWDNSIRIAALASLFILVNSLSGVTGLLVSGTFEVPWLQASALFAAVIIGGQLGVRISLNKLTENGIRLITALLVLIVGARVLLINGFELTFLS